MYICEFTKLADYRINLPFKTVVYNLILKKHLFSYIIYSQFDLLKEEERLQKGTPFKQLLKGKGEKIWMRD